MPRDLLVVRQVERRRPVTFHDEFDHGVSPARATNQCGRPRVSSPGLTGRSSNHRARDGAKSLSHQQRRDYWIFRAGGAMTVIGLGDHAAHRCRMLLSPPRRPTRALAPIATTNSTISMAYIFGMSNRL